MDRVMAEAIHKSINTALAGITIPGVSFEPVNSVRYGSGKATARIVALYADPDTLAKPKLSADEAELLAFVRHARSFGFSETDYNRTFENQGQSFKLCGIKPKSYKYPLVCKSARGTLYKFTVKDVKNSMGIPLSTWDSLSDAMRAESRREAAWEARVS